MKEFWNRIVTIPGAATTTGMTRYKRVPLIDYPKFVNMQTRFFLSSHSPVIIIMYFYFRLLVKSIFPPSDYLSMWPNIFMNSIPSTTQLWSTLRSITCLPPHLTLSHIPSASWISRSPPLSLYIYICNPMPPTNIILTHTSDPLFHYLCSSYVHNPPVVHFVLSLAWSSVSILPLLFKLP